MGNTILTKENIQNIVSGRESNPFAFLGFHKLENDSKSAVIRVFNPFAQKISVVAKGLSVELPMEKIHEDGLYEVLVGEEDNKYKLLITDDTGREILTDDTYSFPPTIGEFDNYLLREGNHFELYHKMGAHLMTLNNVEGVSFAVWAPDAYRVS
ncbi:MAG: 1,4-alpha-glucan branching enzyme, partial [Alphaproteobacteria bacterium]|nr:1,4-alpha-glucan branching enzyme [Alphaproteobacteria bacterium]